MDAAELRRRRDEVAERHGAWTAHNIHLGQGVYTMGEVPEFTLALPGPGPEPAAGRLRRLRNVLGRR